MLRRRVPEVGPSTSPPMASVDINSSTVSTGIRFTTLPDATPPSFLLTPESSASSSSLQHAPQTPFVQPPTTITALFNPMMGHISGAYAARVSRDLSLCSRFDFNVYSYESEWTVGTEWWLRRSKHKTALSVDSNHVDVSIPEAPWPVDEVTGVVKARASTSNVGFALFLYFHRHRMLLTVIQRRMLLLCGRAGCRTS